MFKSFRLVLLAILMFGVMNCNAQDKEKIRKIKIVKDKSFTLGAVITNLQKDELKEKSLSGGAKVIKVFEESAAEKGGLKKDDIIVKFDGKKVESPTGISDIIADIEEEKTVEIEVLRGAKKVKISAKLEKQENQNVLIDIDEDEIKEMYLQHGSGILPKIKFFGGKQGDKGGFLGVEAKNVKEQMKEYFEVKNGVLIEKIIEDSPAQKAGLKAGDVIVKISDRKIEDFSDLVRVLNYYNPEEKVTIEYSRKGKSAKITATLAKKPQSKHLMKLKENHPDINIEWFEDIEGGDHDIHELLEAEGEYKEIIII